MDVDPAPNPRMSAAAYLVWERRQTDRHEFLDGEVVAMAGGSPRHNMLGLAVGSELRLAARGGPGRVFSSDQRIVAREGEHYVYADASMACAAIQLSPGTSDVLANPAVLVEVLSASTEAYDRGRKWEGYQQIASLTDYLLVSQQSAHVEHFQRGASGAWTYRVATAGGHLTLTNGAVLEVDAIYAGAFDLEGDA